MPFNVHRAVGQVCKVHGHHIGGAGELRPVINRGCIRTRCGHAEAEHHVFTQALLIAGDQMCGGQLAALQS